MGLPLLGNRVANPAHGRSMHGSRDSANRAGAAPNSVLEAIILARTRPGEVRHGPAGLGSIGHVSGAPFARGRLGPTGSTCLTAAPAGC